MLFPMADRLFIALQRPARGPLATPAQPAQNAPHVAGRFKLDPLGEFPYAFGVGEVQIGNSNRQVLGSQR